MSVDNIPLIDLAPSFADDAGRERVAGEIRSACETIGFFTVRGHGVPDAVVNGLLSNARAFFSQPVETKLRTPQPVERISRGYSQPASRGLAYSTGTRTPPDLQESFAMGPVDEAPREIVGTDAEKLFFMRNVWPDSPVGLRKAFEDYYRAMEGLSIHLLRLFARALALDEHFFDGKVSHHTSTMRVIHYPPQQGEPEPGQLRAGEHTDYGTLTILKGEDVPGGLQVKLRNGGWVDVHPAPDAFVCNIGDLMMRWTNDHWVSNPHRVANPPREFAHIGRLSIPFFHNVNLDADIRCIRSFYGASEAEKYPPVLFGEYYMSKHMKAQHMKAETTAGD